MTSAGRRAARADRDVYRQKKENNKWRAFRNGQYYDEDRARIWHTRDRETSFLKEDIFKQDMSLHLEDSNHWGYLRLNRAERARDLLRGAGVNRFRNATEKAPIQKALNEVAKSLAQFGIEYKRTLGWGGMGLAALFECTSDAGDKEDIVVKIAIKGQNTQKDKNWGHLFARTRHLVRRERLTWLYRRKAVRMGDQGAMAAAGMFDTSNTTVLFEYLKFGELSHVIERAHKYWDRTGTRIPQKVYWSVFRCLVKAALGMDYPYQREKIDGVWVDYAAEEKDPIDEQLPATSNSRSRALAVHFDIDPRNIFVGDFCEEHTDCPILKIGDYGCMEAYKTITSDPDKLWRWRRGGKVTWATPEQFCEEWELDPSDPRLDGKPEVAGHFLRSNIYQIGLVMLSFITGRGPPLPPIPTKAGVVIQGVDVYTYGGDFLEDSWDGLDTDTRTRLNNVEDDLRALIVLCLAHYPDHRPSLKRLFAAFEDRFTRAFRESDEEVRNWSNAVFREVTFHPPKPPVPFDFARAIVDDRYQIDPEVHGVASVPSPRPAPPLHVVPPPGNQQAAPGRAVHAAAGVRARNNDPAALGFNIGGLAGPVPFAGGNGPATLGLRFGNLAIANPRRNVNQPQPQPPVKPAPDSEAAHGNGLSTSAIARLRAEHQRELLVNARANPDFDAWLVDMGFVKP